MSNAMGFWIGDRVEKDAGGECLGDPPSHDCRLEVAIDSAAPSDEHNPRSVPRMQISRSRWKAVPALRKGAAKENTTHIIKNTTSSEKAMWHEKVRVIDTPNDAERDLRSCVQRCLKRESQSPGGAASSTRFRDGEHSVKASSPARRE